LPRILSIRKGDALAGYALIFVNLNLGRSKFITQVPEEVTREFSSLPFTSDIYVYIYTFM